MTVTLAAFYTYPEKNSCIYKGMFDMIRYNFTRITSDVAPYMDMMACAWCLTKMPAQVPHTAAVPLKKTLSCGGFRARSSLAPK